MEPKKIIAAVFVAVGLAGILGLVGLVQVFVSGFSQTVKDDQINSPGKVQFLVEDYRIASLKNGMAVGNSAESSALAASFSSRFQEICGIASKGDNTPTALLGAFPTYCRIVPGQVVILCHVPHRRGPESDMRTWLAQVSWKLAQELAAQQHLDGNAALVVGLRGSDTYGVICEGNVAGQAMIKSDGPDCVKHLYPYFIPSRPDQ